MRTGKVYFLILLLVLSVCIKAAQGCHRDEKELKVGYLIITPDPGTASPAAILSFSQSNAFTEVEARAPNLTDRAMVTTMDGEVAIAIANPSHQSAVVTLEPIQNPLILGPMPASKQIEIPPYNQIVRFLKEIFEKEIPTRFTPMLSISSNVPISMVAFKAGKTDFTRTPVLSLSTEDFVVPVRDGVGGRGAIVVPLFLEGMESKTRLSLVNPTDNRITGQVDVFDSTGNPMVVTLNGQAASAFRYGVLPNFLFSLATTKVEYVPDQILVTFKPGTPRAVVDEINKGIGATVIGTSLGDPELYQVRIPSETDLEDAIDYYRQNAHVAQVGKNFIACIAFGIWPPSTPSPD